MKKNLFSQFLNRVLHLLCQFLPGATTLRPFLHRLRGVKIHGKVFIGDQVYIENAYPECVEIHEGVQIGIRSIILAHFRGAGRVVVEKNVWIGPNCVIATSPKRTLTIGEGAVIGASSVVTMDIPSKAFYALDKATHIANVRVPLTLETSYESFLRGLTPIKHPGTKGQRQ
jgi:acetyltransferase-like isoleucine patch superfamily enzyme